MKLKNIFAKATMIMLVITFAISVFVPIGQYINLSELINLDMNVFANEYNEYYYGLGDEPIDYHSDPLNVQNYSNFDGDTNVELPSKVDLSESEYFPPIGSQMGMNSCVAWATTYYQFTYEANKLNGISVDENNASSPAWIFNLWNGGENKGSANIEAYNLLKQYGAVTMQDAPYRTTNGSTYISSDNFDYSWCTNSNAMIEALNTRLIGHDVITIPSQGTAIENADSDSLKKIKQLLYGTNGTDGKILNIRVLIGSNWSYAKRNIYNAESGLADIYINSENGKTEEIVYRASEGGNGHAMTVVGYDDDVWCDINGNNVMEPAELGAFKVANSWGDDWCNEGYVWVAYDALNKVSAVSGNWESSEDGERNSIFDRGIYVNGSKANAFYYIDVENKEVEYVGQLTIDTDYRNSLSVYAGRNTSISTSISNTAQKFKLVGDSSKEISYKGTIVFDYADLAEPISDYISDYNWFIRLKGNHNSSSFKITDNLSNTIVDFGDISTGDSYKPISLSMGDLNYDGVNDVKDSKILFNAVYRGGKLSNLQEYLASNMNSKFPINAAVTPSKFDDIGTVLDDINVGNINWDTVPANVDLQTLIDGDYDVLFINCSSNADVDGEVIRGFVEQGGTVYASDWALDSIEDAFPERNITHVVMEPQNTVGNVVDKGLLTSIGLENIPIDFDMASWRLVTSELQDDVTVYIEGKVTGALSKSYPLVFSFPYGDNGGKVFYTSFHQSANSSQEMNEFMNDLVIMINHNKDINAISEWSKENGYKNIMPVTAVLNSAEESDSYLLNNIDTTSDFAILTDESGDVSIKLIAPDGSIYTNYENGEFVTGDIETTDNEMQIYSMGKRGLSVSAPIVADNGEWSFRIVSNVSYRSSFAVAAAEKSKKISTENYTVDYKIAEDWGSGQNIQVTITNTGDEPIRNWALKCDNFHGTVTNVWNGMLHGENIIRNAMYNSDIAPGTSVTLGYTLTNADGEIPVMNLCNFRKVKQEGYTVEMDVLSEWGSGFIGAITITNTTDDPIMAWELSFDTENFDISSTSQFLILENTDNHYKITGTYNGNIPIPANTSITLQFNGIKSENPYLTNIFLTEATF